MPGTGGSWCINPRLVRRLSLAAILLGDVSAPAATAPRFDSWTTENGLPQNSILDIVQTRDGYMWFATEGGLARFDGVRFVVFDSSTPGMKSQRIAALHESRDGTLWAATRDGMLIRYRDGRFTTYTSEDGLPAASAIRIEEDDGGRLWVTWLGAMTRVDGREFTTFRSGELPENVVAPAPVPPYLYLDAWWSLNSKGLHVLVRGEVRTVAAPGAIPDRITGVNVDRRQNVWIRTERSGVFRAANGRIEQYTTRNGLPRDDPRGIFHDDGEGSSWFWDNDSSGLYRIRDGTCELMPLGSPRAFYVDREGSTWIGTLDAGVHRLRETNVRVLTERDGLSLDRVYSLLRDRHGVVWVGTWEGGVNRYADGRFRSFNTREGLPSGFVTSLFEDRTGALWVGTSLGPARLSGDRFRPYDEGQALLTGNIWAMLEDRAGAMWFATDHGLVQASGGRFIRYTSRDGLTSDRVTALFEDRRGALWIGAFQGVTRLEDGVFTSFGEAQGFVGNEVRAFHEDEDGFLWIGTYDSGLYRLASGRLTRYTRRDGLHDNGVFQILSDDAGYLWMGSNRGISRVSRRELIEVADRERTSVVPLVLSARDGLAIAEINGGRQPSGLKAPDGTLWFPTMGGIAIVDPRAISDDAGPPRVVVEEVRVAGDAVDHEQSVRVPASARSFEIRYTAPTFIQPDRVRFRYRVAGLTDGWIDAGDQRTVSFYKVPPGRYTFAVVASSHTGVWSGEEETLEVVVLPPFWSTWWFRLVIAGALASTIVAAHHRRLHGLRRQQAQRSVYLQELLASQERERNRISNDMHDSLGYDLSVVKQRAREALQKLPAGDADARQDLAEILDVAQRIEGEMKGIAHALRPYHLDKVGLEQSLRDLVDEMGRAGRVQLTAGIAGIDHLFPRDAETHIYRMVQEALTNIVKHAQASSARVAVQRDGRHVVITIDDDGAGLPQGMTSGTSDDIAAFGVIGIRERAQLLGGSAEIRSRPRAGTSLVIRIPIFLQAAGA